LPYVPFSRCPLSSPFDPCRQGRHANPVPQTNVVDTNNNAGLGASAGPKPTTTISTTQTSTLTVTVKPVASATGTNAVGQQAEGSGASECLPAVTVTVALSTVTVTYTPSAPSAAAQSANAKAVGNGPVATTVASAIPEVTEPAAPSSLTTVEEAPAVVTHSVAVIPLPYVNSTATSTGRTSSGFLRLPRPTGTGSSIAPASTGGWLY